ncbi:MAG: molybdenum cofactor synthesis domain protein [Actinomycetia bacterium]|nr:molybdenum cofactor synthesis domain protein [Actinomycetes bacterium]
MSPGGGLRPVPRVAYERWLDSLVRADWSATGDRRTGDGRDSERITVGEALGRVTAAPVVARWPSPRTDCAAMDGIAVRAADLAAAPAVSGADSQTRDAPAGGQAIRLPAGLFEWIDTGDPMPAGADSVILRERLLPQADGSVIITAASGGAGGGQQTGHAARGRNVRAAGEDFGAGEILVPPGRRLRPGDLAAVAAGGHVSVIAARPPVVAIIPTGDEIRPVGTVPRFGDIIDTNSLMLTARCRQLCAVPVVSAVVPDDPDALAVELRHAAGRADLVLVIAGSSRGRGDHAAAVLAQVGGVAVAGVAVRPGHPALLGHAKRPEVSHGHQAEGPADRRTGVAPVIGLPGYPLATAVVFELFAVPMLRALTGQALARVQVRARLDRDWSSPADVEDWVLVTLTADADGGVPVATPARRGAGSISQLARADAWWPIPAGQGTFTAGTQVEVLPIPGTD